MSDSRKKYEELVEEGRIREQQRLDSATPLPFPYLNDNGDEEPTSFKDYYDDFVDEHNDPTNITLFCDYLDSIFRQ